MSKSLINPFELLGITEKSTVRDAKKAYYQLALLCHPDCGGHEESMKVLVNAYSFVEQQIKNKNDISGDCDDMGKELEREFEEYCKGLEAVIPKMTDLYDLAEMQEKIKDMDSRNYQAYNRQFNIEFEDEQKYNFEELVANDPFSQGYGDLMDDNEDDGNKTDEEFVIPTKNQFKGEISIYKEPNVLPDSYGTNFRYDIDKVDDFSNYENNEFDYVKAHTELEKEPTSIKDTMDTPMKNLDKAMENLLKERDQLNVSHSQIDLVLKGFVNVKNE